MDSGSPCQGQRHSDKNSPTSVIVKRGSSLEPSPLNEPSTDAVRTSPITEVTGHMMNSFQANDINGAKAKSFCARVENSEAVRSFPGADMNENRVNTPLNNNMQETATKGTSKSGESDEIMKSSGQPFLNTTPSIPCRLFIRPPKKNLEAFTWNLDTIASVACQVAEAQTETLGKRPAENMPDFLFHKRAKDGTENHDSETKSSDETAAAKSLETIATACAVAKADSEPFGERQDRIAEQIQKVKARIDRQFSDHVAGPGSGEGKDFNGEQPEGRSLSPLERSNCRGIMEDVLQQFDTFKDEVARELGTLYQALDDTRAEYRELLRTLQNEKRLPQNVLNNRHDGSNTQPREATHMRGMATLAMRGSNARPTEKHAYLLPRPRPSNGATILPRPESRSPRTSTGTSQSSGSQVGTGERGSGGQSESDSLPSTDGGAMRVVRKGGRKARGGGPTKRRRDNWTAAENEDFLRLVRGNEGMEEMDLRRMLARHFAPRRTHEQCANHLRILRAQKKVPAAIGEAVPYRVRGTAGGRA